MDPSVDHAAEGEGEGGGAFEDQGEEPVDMLLRERNQQRQEQEKLEKGKENLCNDLSLLAPSLSPPPPPPPSLSLSLSLSLCSEEALQCVKRMVGPTTIIHPSSDMGETLPPT